MNNFIEKPNYYLYMNFYKYLDVDSLITFIKINKESLKKKKYIYNFMFQHIKLRYITRENLKYILSPEIIHDEKYMIYRNLDLYTLDRINVRPILNKIKNNVKLMKFLLKYETLC